MSEVRKRCPCGKVLSFAKARTSDYCGRQCRRRFTYERKRSRDLTPAEELLEAAAEVLPPVPHDWGPEKPDDHPEETAAQLEALLTAFPGRFDKWDRSAVSRTIVAILRGDRELVLVNGEWRRRPLPEGVSYNLWLRVEAAFRQAFEAANPEPPRPAPSFERVRPYAGGLPQRPGFKFPGTPVE